MRIINIQLLIMDLKQIILGALIFFGIMVGKAQTVNVGNLFVAKNTTFSVIGNFENKESSTYKNNGESHFRGDFKNNGTVTFDNDLGYTRFEGSVNQDIKGTGTKTEFNNILFNNTGQQTVFKVSIPISISGKAEFSKGIVNSEDVAGSITFTETGYQSGASNDSFVDGKVIKKGNGEFLFPIGDKNTYHFASISSPGIATAGFDAKYFFENTNTLYPTNQKDGNIIAIDENEYWQINKISNTEENVLITLNWSETSIPEKLFSETDGTFHVVRWDATNKIWVDEGGIVDNVNKTVTTITKVLEYGIFTIAFATSDSTDDGGVIVYNGVTPNGDDVNDNLFIENIDKFPKNKIMIFSRWGTKVFETTNYGSSGNVFDGRKKGSDTPLPTGTYYYVLEYEYNRTGSKSRMIKKVGYLFLGNSE